MPDKRFSDRQLDAAIDRVVRDMMSVEPRSDLRARVLAELDGPSARITFWPRLAFATLALTLAIAALMIVRQDAPEHVDAPRVATSAPSPATTPEPAAPRSTSTSTSTSPSTNTLPLAPRSASGTAPGPRPPRTATTTASRSEPVQDRLVQAASIPSIDDATAGPPPVEPVDDARSTGFVNLKPITQSEIVITPITVERIEITPLSSRR
jgi:hypothetical protein